MEVIISEEVMKKFNKVYKALKCDKSRIVPVVRYGNEYDVPVINFINSDATVLYELVIKSGYEVHDPDDVLIPMIRMFDEGFGPATISSEDKDDKVNVTINYKNGVFNKYAYNKVRCFTFKDQTSKPITSTFPVRFGAATQASVWKLLDGEVEINVEQWCMTLQASTDLFEERVMIMGKRWNR